MVTDWVAVVFGGGSQWVHPRNRLSTQLKSTLLFMDVLTYSEANLPQFGLLEKWLVEKYSRGFGLWFWKPRVIADALDKFPNASGVLYLDAGCELNINEESLLRLTQYLSLAEQMQGMVFEMDHLERLWTHPLLISDLDPEFDAEQRQLSATVIFLANSNSGNLFLKEWIEWSQKDNFKYLRLDEVPVLNNSDFIAHRHDQSILSILWRKHRLGVLADESYWYPKWRITGKKYPIWAARNKSRISTNMPYPLYLATIFARRVFQKMILLLGAKRSLR